MFFPIISKHFPGNPQNIGKTPESSVPVLSAGPLYIEKMEAAFVPYGSVDWWVHRDYIAKAQQALRRPFGSYGVMANPRRRRQTSWHTPMCRQPGIDVQLIKFSERHSGVCLQPWLPKKISAPCPALGCFFGSLRDWTIATVMTE